MDPDLLLVFPKVQANSSKLILSFNISGTEPHDWRHILYFPNPNPTRFWYFATGTSLVFVFPCRYYPLDVGGVLPFCHSDGGYPRDGVLV